MWGAMEPGAPRRLHPREEGLCTGVVFFSSVIDERRYVEGLCLSIVVPMHGKRVEMKKCLL